MSPLILGLKGRCPACGGSRLFKGYLKVVESCEGCGQSFDEWAGSDGPSYFVMFIVVILVPTLALLLEYHVAPPTYIHVVLWVPLTLVLSLGLLPVFKGLFIALELKNQTDSFAKDTKTPKRGRKNVRRKR